MKIIKFIQLLAFIFIFTVSTVLHAKDQEKITFKSTANSRATTIFIRGMQSLHNFEYERARADFIAVQELDPTFPLGYWGEAMTYNHPLWLEQNTAAGKRALTKYAKTANERESRTHDPKERGLMHAVDLLFGEGTKVERDCRYAEAMYELYKQYPDDDEVAAFYALAILGATEGERDERFYMQAAAIAEDILLHNPQHPGALHYAIHSYDDPIHAPLGLRAARRYASIASDASHALHMPSHIFLALGMWSDVIASNRAAWDAGFKQNPNLDPQKVTVHDLHALQWLIYGQLQQNDQQSALKNLRIMEKLAKENPTTMLRWYYGLTLANYLSDTAAWNTNLERLPSDDIELSARANLIYVDVMKSLQTTNADNKIKIQEAINKLKKLCKSIPHNLPTNQKLDDFFTSITTAGINTGKIIVLELEAQVKLKEGDLKSAIAIAREAMQLEDATPFGYGPPSPVKPAHELLAELLTLDHDYLGAYKAYLAANKRTPNRLSVVNGIINVKAELKKRNIVIPAEDSPYYHELMRQHVH